MLVQHLSSFRPRAPRSRRWRSSAAPRARGGDPGKADRILVLKGKRELQLLRGEVMLKSYPIALGPHPKGPKRRFGDGRTPEGVYVIDAA